jgi:signal transduction histidine kinase
MLLVTLASDGTSPLVRHPANVGMATASGVLVAPSAPNVGIWFGVAAGLAIAAAAMLVAWFRVRAARREAAKARELASHLENERDLAQQALVSKLEQERELSKEKMQFESQLTEFEKYASLAQLALGAAHEINNPLLGILSHLELDWKDATGERRAEIEQCIESARRISSAVHGLLDYARPGPLTLSPVDLKQLVGEAVRFVEHQPLFRGLELQNCVPDDLPILTADTNQLSQILMNLLLNAAQATPAGGSITVLAEKPRFSETVELCVRDTGTGIAEDIQPHVFEPFFTTKRGKGTGLGLSITRNYVRRHGGEIHLDSFPGHGTAVHVTLPIHQSSQRKTLGTEVIT